MRSFLSRGKFAWCLAPGGASGVRSRPAPARRILGGAKCRWPDACQGRSRQVGRYIRRFRRWRIVSASFSCGDRPVTSRTPPASTAQTECASGYGSPWRSAQCAGRRHGLAARQLGARGLRRSHRLGDPFLRLVGFAARLDDRGGDGELVFQRVMGRDKFRSWPVPSQFCT
jgi:hypothetical protein